MFFFLTANNNYPLRGGKFNNFEGGQSVNALFAGGWVGAKPDKNRLSPFTSDTMMSINDLAETLLEMVTDRPYPDGGMRNAPRPLTGVPMWKAILQKTQVPCKITYSEVMELRVGPDITDFKKSDSPKTTLLSLMGAGHPTSPTTPSLSRTSATSMFDVAAHPTVTRPCSHSTITGMGNLLPGVLGLFLMPCSGTLLHRSCFQCCEEITRRTGNAKKHGTQRGDVPCEAGVCIDLGLYGVLRPSMLSTLFTCSAVTKV